MTVDKTRPDQNLSLFLVCGILGFTGRDCIILLCSAMTGYTPTEKDSIRIFLLAISSILALGIAWYAYRSGGGKETFFRFMGFFRWVWRWKFLFTALMVFFGSCMISLCWQQLLKVVGLAPVVPEATAWGIHVLKNRQLILFALYVFYTLAVAPVSEEFFFRRVLGDVFSFYFPEWLAASLQAFIFSLLHFSVSAFPALFFLGYILFWCYRKYQTLWAAVFIHGFYNFYCWVLLWLGLQV